MDLVLHVGAHRCASTTFQQFLHRNAAALAAAGVRSWTPDRTRAGLFSGLIQQSHDASPQRDRHAHWSTGLIRVEMARLDAAGARQLLISEENLVGSVQGNLRDGRLYPDAAVRLARFRPAAQDRRLRIGLAIRSYDSFWASSMSCAVAQGHPVPAAAAIGRIAAQDRGWPDLVRDLASVFPAAEIVIWPFERLAGQPEAQLAILTGGTTVAGPLAGLRCWQNPGPRRDKLARLLRLRGDSAGAEAMGAAGDRWMPFDADQQADLRDRYARDLAWLDAGAEGIATFADAAPRRWPSPPTTATEHDEAATGPAAAGAALVPETRTTSGGRHLGTQSFMV